MDTATLLDLKSEEETFDTDPILVTIGPVNGARLFDRVEIEIPSDIFPCLSNPIYCPHGLTFIWRFGSIFYTGTGMKRFCYGNLNSHLTLDHAW